MNQGRRNRRLYPSGTYYDADGVLHTVRTTDLPVVDPGTADLPEIEVAFAPPSVEDMEAQYRAWLARQPRDDAAQEARNR